MMMMMMMMMMTRLFDPLRGASGVAIPTAIDHSIEVDIIAA